jgi:hypothetical protein
MGRANFRSATAASLLQGLNMAVNAFVKWSLGSSFDVTLLGVTEMPKPGTKLSLDFASLLGALLWEHTAVEMRCRCGITTVVQSPQAANILL